MSLKHGIRSVISLLLAGTCFGSAVFADGSLPSLDLPSQPSGITPISELDTRLEKVELELDRDVPAKISPVNTVPQKTAKELLPAKAETKANEKPLDAEIPAVNTDPAPQEEKRLHPVSFSPLPAIVVFPVIKHQYERAFGDLPIVFAREYAQRMEIRVPETRIYHPVYTVDEIRMRGLGHLYDQIMNYYIKAGRPEPRAMDYLLKQLAGDGKTVSRVVFVEADLDMSHPAERSGLVERATGWMTDGTPKQMKHYVRSRVQIFDAEAPEVPLVWAGSWRRSIKTDQFLNVTTSVFDDSDSQQAFAKVSREMSREILYITPKAAYMAPQYDLAVHGRVVSKKEALFPNFSEMLSSRKPLNDENRRAIQRILQRQNAISP